MFTLTKDIRQKKKPDTTKLSKTVMQLPTYLHRIFKIVVSIETFSERRKQEKSFDKMERNNMNT